MGGDIWQWGEQQFIPTARTLRVLGGSWSYFSGELTSAYNSTFGFGYDHMGIFDDIGFRVASVPEPSTITLLLAGAIGLLAYAWRRRPDVRHTAPQSRPRPAEFHRKMYPTSIGGHVGRNWQPARQVGLAPLPTPA